MSEKRIATMDITIQLNNLAIDEVYLSPNTVLALRLPKEIPPYIIINIQETVVRALRESGNNNAVVCIPDKGSIDTLDVKGIEAVRDYCNIMIDTLKGNIVGA